MGIPRPTLYRYLREYSIPHLRRSGKISIPEESLARIREARELHKEGLGTESVRSKLQSGSAPEEIAGHLERLSKRIESLQDRGLGEEGSTSQEALQAILEKQELLISAVSDLTEKMDDLLSTGTRVPRPLELAPGELEEEAYRMKALSHWSENSPASDEKVGSVSEKRRYAYAAAEGNFATVASAGGTANGVAADEPAAEAVEDNSTARIIPESPEHLFVPKRRETFGALARRRRRGVLALLLGLLIVALVGGWWLAAGEEEAGQPAAGEQEAEQEAEQPGSNGQAVEEDSVSVPAAEDEAPEAPETISAPYVVGLTFPEAQARLAEVGLGVGNIGEMASYQIPAGEVVAQEPLEGAQADPDTQMNLTVSAGPPANQPGVPAGAPSLGAAQYPVQVAPLPYEIVQNPAGRVQPGSFAPMAPVFPVAD